MNQVVSRPTVGLFQVFSQLGCEQGTFWAKMVSTGKLSTTPRGSHPLTGYAKFALTTPGEFPEIKQKYAKVSVSLCIYVC